MNFVLTCHVTKEDYIQFCLHVKQRTVLLKHHLAVLGVIIFFLLLENFIVKSPPPIFTIINTLTGFFLFATLVTIFSIWRYPKKLSAEIDNGAATQFISTYTLSFHDDFFVDEGVNERTEARYPVITKIAATKSLLLLMRTSNWGWIIPKDSFESIEQLTEFLDFLAIKTNLSLSGVDKELLFGKE